MVLLLFAACTGRQVPLGDSGAPPVDAVDSVEVLPADTGEPRRGIGL
jgi:hypothetical protein